MRFEIFYTIVGIFAGISGIIITLAAPVNSVSANITTTATAIVFLILVIILFIITRKLKLYPAYNLAIIGLPQSGKTTLITAMFGELFLNRIQGIKIVPRGNQL